MEVIYNKEKSNLINGKSAYECHGCGIVFNWDHNSCWYGSYKEMEETPNKIKYYCSENCFNKKSQPNK